MLCSHLWIALAYLPAVSENLFQVSNLTAFPVNSKWTRSVFPIRTLMSYSFSKMGRYMERCPADFFPPVIILFFIYPWQRTLHAHKGASCIGSFKSASLRHCSQGTAFFIWKTSLSLFLLHLSRPDFFVSILPPFPPHTQISSLFSPLWLMVWKWRNRHK